MIRTKVSEPFPGSAMDGVGDLRTIMQRELPVEQRIRHHLQCRNDLENAGTFSADAEIGRYRHADPAHGSKHGHTHDEQR